MNITPDEIRSQHFKNSFRGYDTLEVRDFLDFVGDEMAQLIEEYERLKNKVLKKDELLLQYQQEEEQLKKAMLSAQQVADDITQKARAEADKIIQKARRDQEQIIHQAKIELEEVTQEIDKLKNTKSTFINKLTKTVKDGERLLKLWNQNQENEDQKNA